MKLGIGIGCLALLAGGCGDRNEFWDQPSAGIAPAFGLQSSVVVLDGPADRALVFRSRGGELVRTSLKVGRNIVASAISSDMHRVALLAAGEQIQDEPDDPKPQLTIVDAPPGAEPSVRTFPLKAPRTGLVLDPRGEFALVHATPSTQGSSQLAENPNELIFVNLIDGSIVTRSLRSFGSKPQRFTFTPPLGLPGGTRRLLIVETEQDLTLIDLAHLDRPEITVRLTSGQDARVVQPAGVAFDDGDPARDDDTRLAVRTQNGSDVVTITFRPAADAPSGFAPSINLASAGGVVSDLAFVQTDTGLRVAALVPSARKAVLIEPDTSRTVDVELGASLSRMSLAGGSTDAVSASAAGDVALLYGANGSSSVAFWSFRGAPSRPYRTVEILPLSSPVSEVRSIAQLPGKRMAIGNGSLFVLDLEQRTASPLSTQSGSSVTIAPDGGRFWVYNAGVSELARFEVADLGLTRVQLQRTLQTVFDVETEGGGRSLFAFDLTGTGALTLIDALAPDPARQVHQAGLFLMDAP